jgi:lipopolysaccharide/colanic/teichoic acid biosynthesis glycosyltransferase
VTPARGRLVAREPGGDPPAEVPRREASLVERYREMAHTFQPRPVDRVIRALDVIASGSLLVVLWPLIALCAAAVLASGGRPVLYRGARVGRAGRVFPMYKLRTLRVDAEDRLGPHLGEELSRLTSGELTVAGRALRAAKLDELPQLWNVLRGDMSLVGPRPIRPAFFEELCEAIPAYWQRLVVRPGMTGLAQLRLPREMSWAEKLAHDIEFIADRSVRLYCSVLWQTVSMLAGRALDRRSRG